MLETRFGHPLPLQFGCVNQSGTLWQLLEFFPFVALVLAAYNLFVGGFALLAIQRRWQLFLPAERLADTAREPELARFTR